jgi:hypothetical protein
MNAAEFDRFLRLQLCWLDGVPTEQSHAGQRQCPHCRRKWSYANLSRRWLVAQEFCQGSTRTAAARKAGLDVHTVGHLYKSYQNVLAPLFANSIRQGAASGFHVDPQRLAECCRQAMRTRNPRKRMVLMVELCLAEMPQEGRLEVLYKAAFQEPLRKLIRSAISARLKS